MVSQGSSEKDLRIARLEEDVAEMKSLLQPKMNCGTCAHFKTGTLHGMGYAAGCRYEGKIELDGSRCRQWQVQPDLKKRVSVSSR